jgi:hypothetical protein
MSTAVAWARPAGLFERTLSWLKQFRRLRTRFERLADIGCLVRTIAVRLYNETAPLEKRRYRPEGNAWQKLAEHRLFEGVRRILISLRCKELRFPHLAFFRHITVAPQEVTSENRPRGQHVAVSASRRGGSKSQRVGHVNMCVCVARAAQSIGLLASYASFIANGQ